MLKTGMVYKGINYDVGTNYAPGFLSREVWSEELKRREYGINRLN